MKKTSSLLSKIYKSHNSGDITNANELINQLCKNKLLSYHACQFCKKISDENNHYSKINNFFYKKKFFSIITINFNNLVGLKKTIDSVINQSARKDIQFIVVDGNSTDGSLDYIEEMESKIDLAVYGKDKGVYDAMNRGCDFIHSEYTLFMNSGDCFYDLNIVQKIKEIIIKQPHFPGAVYGKTRRENGKVWITHAIDDLWKGMICSHQSIFIKSKYLVNNPFNISNEVVSDFELIYKIFLKKELFLATDMVISEIEKPGISNDFKSRTIERWVVVRTNPPPNMTKNDIDEFYQTLLSYNEENKGGVHGHKPNKLHYQLINDIQEKVVFLISMPRSGSTLLQRILEKSGQIYSLGEPWVMLPVASLYNNELISAKYSQQLNIQAKNVFTQEMKDNELILKAQRVYADAIYSAILKKIQKNFFLDKTPRYIYVVDELQKIYPNAKFILLLRDPAAIISSYAHTWFKGSYENLLNDPYCKYDLTHGFEKLAAFADPACKNKFVVRYEELISSPEKIIHKLFNYLSLPYHKDVINYNSSNNPIKKYRFGDPSSVYEKNKPDPTHSDKWLDNITTKEDSNAFLSALNVIPEHVFPMLRYNKKDTVEKITKKIKGDCYLLTQAKIDFGENTQVLHEKRLQSQSLPDSSKTLGVLITCYNNQETIVNAINSVLFQSKTPDLIVISDDCSTDGSVKLIQQIAKKHPMIKVIARSRNVGVSANRNLAIKEMNTDYITTLDGDDLFLQGKLELEFMALKGSMTQVVFSHIAILGHDRNFVQETIAYANKSYNEMLNMLSSRSEPVPRDMMFSKCLFEKATGFDTKMNIYEDWAFKMRLILCSEEYGWVHSGGIGTVYDRRNPGLSNKAPVFHAYGQLMALARNADIIQRFPECIIYGLKTVSKQLNGNIRSRMDQFIDHAEKVGVNQLNITNKLNALWESASFCENDQIKFQAIWVFASID